MLQLIRKIIKKVYFSIPWALSVVLVIVRTILLPLVIFWLSLYILAYGEWLVGFILFLVAIFIAVETVAILMSIDDLLSEIEKKKRKGRKE